MKRLLHVAFSASFLVTIVFALALPNLLRGQQPIKGSIALDIAMKQVKDLKANEGITFKPVVHPALLEVKRLRGMQGLTGLRVPADIGPASLRQNLKLAKPPLHLKVRFEELPDEFDVRQEIKKKFKDKDIPVQNQGGCGSCWVFAAIGAYEANFLYQGTNGGTVNAAEQHPLSCLSARGVGSCQTGGWPADTFEFLIREGTGSRSDPAMRYQGQNGQCVQNPSIAFKAVEWGYVDPVDAPADSDRHIPSRDKLKAAIKQYGAVTVAVNATDAMTSYDSGVFNFNEAGSVNHAVTIVGWKKINPKGEVAWLVRNSWGDDYGEDGHIWIKEGVNRIGYGAMWVNAARSNGQVDPVVPDKNCPCPSGGAMNYNAEIRLRIDYWTNVGRGFSK